MADETNSTRKRRFSLRNRPKMAKTQSKEISNDEIHSPYFASSTKIADSVLQSKKIKKNCSDTLNSDPENSCKTNALDTREHPRPNKVLGREFYDCYASNLAQHLLGKRINRVLDDGTVLSALIVETEGYLGETDKACHSYGGKKTSRTEAMYMAPGTAYVYFIYGMYFCLNISSKDTGGAVLIRALEPVQGIERMTELRSKKRNGSTTSKALKVNKLCNGPSKLCQAMNITKANLNKEDMATSNTLWIEDDPDVGTSDLVIVTSTRIGVNSYGQDAAQMPLRFYLYGNKCISVRDKTAEKLLVKDGSTVDHQS